MSQYFYAIRTSCHLLNLITGFTRGVIRSWYQCGFVAVFGTLHVSSPYHQPCFGVFFCRCLFIRHPGTAGTNTLGPGLPSLWLALLRAGSSPTSAWAGDSFGEEDAECHGHTPPLHPSVRRCRVYCCCITCELAISSLCWHLEALGGPALQTHGKRQPVPPRQNYLTRPGGGRTYIIVSPCVQPWHRQSNQQRVTGRGDESISPRDTQSILPHPGQDSDALPLNPNSHGAATQQHV